jgi:hypothetical protein
MIVQHVDSTGSYPRPQVMTSETRMGGNHWQVDELDVALGPWPPLANFPTSHDESTWCRLPKAGHEAPLVCELLGAADPNQMQVSILNSFVGEALPDVNVLGAFSNPHDDVAPLNASIVVLVDRSPGFQVGAKPMLCKRYRREITSASALDADGCSASAVDRVLQLGLPGDWGVIVRNKLLIAQWQNKLMAHFQSAKSVRSLLRAESLQ